MNKSIRSRSKHKSKIDKTIKDLFKELRRQSISRLSTKHETKSCDTSVIEIDDSRLNDTVMLVEGATGNMNNNVQSDIVIKTKKNKQRQAKPIIINDDPKPLKPGRKYSLHHSTPIKEKPSLDNLILDVSNQINEDINNNKTKEINASSFLTIDLTTESGFNRSSMPTVIDLDDTDNQDCVLTSVSQSSSMSGDSDVTVLQRPNTSRSLTRQIKRGLQNLNQSEKDKILEFISENLFNGCSVPAKIPPRTPESVEDTYIKEVIVGRKLSRNSIGSNVYNPKEYVNTSGLRMIVIDGSNVATKCEGDWKIFLVPRLKLVIDFFLSRGHVVKAFVPRFRNKTGKSSHPLMLIELERAGHVIFTPSREVYGYDISSYDDRYIVQCAAEFEGIIVSNDAFRDLIHENRSWEHVIRNRVLQFNWVNGMIMFPRDPLGRNGPKLEDFLKMPKTK